MYCGSKGNYNYQVIGLSDTFPTLDNCNRNWKQFVVTNTLNLNECNPDIETIDKIYISSQINKTIVVETPLSNPPLVQNLEGNYLSGRKLLVEGQLCENIVYTSLTDCQSVHSVNFVNPFSTYIILSNPNLELGPADIIVNVYIENAFATLINPRSIFKSVSIFVSTNEEFVANYVGNITITPAITVPGAVTGCVTFQNTANNDLFYGTISNGSYSINILEPGTYNLIDASILVGGQTVAVDIPDTPVSITVPATPTCSSGNAGPDIPLTLTPAIITGTITGLTQPIANELNGITMTVNGGMPAPVVTIDITNPLLPTYSFESTDIGTTYTLGTLTADPATIILTPVTTGQPLATIDLSSLGTTITADIPIVPSIAETTVSGTINGITQPFADLLTGLELTVTNGTTTVPVTINLDNPLAPTYSFTATNLGNYVLNAITPTPDTLTFVPDTLNQVLATITTDNAGTPITDVDIDITPTIPLTTVTGAITGLTSAVADVLTGITMTLTGGDTPPTVTVDITDPLNPLYSFTTTEPGTFTLADVEINGPVGTTINVTLPTPLPVLATVDGSDTTLTGTDVNITATIV